MNKIRLEGLAFSRPSRDFRNQVSFPFNQKLRKFWNGGKKVEKLYWERFQKCQKLWIYEPLNWKFRTGNKWNGNFPERNFQNLGNVLKPTDNICCSISHWRFWFPEFQPEFFIEWKAPQVSQSDLTAPLSQKSWVPIKPKLEFFFRFFRLILQLLKFFVYLPWSMSP